MVCLFVHLRTYVVTYIVVCDTYVRTYVIVCFCYFICLLVCVVRVTYVHLDLFRFFISTAIQRVLQGLYGTESGLEVLIYVAGPTHACGV